MAVIKDVARLAGVSVGTVSKYLNNPQDLKESTRNKVEQAIAQLDYKPSPLARSMRTGKTYSTAIIVPDITNPFFAEVYNSLRVPSEEQGYTPILYTTGNQLSVLKTCLSDIRLRQADGIFLCFLDEDDETAEYISSIQEQLPIVLLSWDFKNRFPSVVVDVFDGIYKSTAYMIGLGHQKIAYIGGSRPSSFTSEKFNGYRKAMADAGLQVDERHVFSADYSMIGGYQTARELYMLAETPTAIVASNDIQALGCLKFLIQKGIRIPDDIAVIGFDNITLSAMYEPALSTISLPVAQIGAEAVKLLQHTRHNPSAPKKIFVETELVIRNSTDKNAPVELLI